MQPFLSQNGQDSEAEQVIALLKAQGLGRGQNGLRVIMMCEIPSNALLADRFLEHFDGFSIGSNDMTQLTLAVDRDAIGIFNIAEPNDVGGWSVHTPAGEQPVPMPVAAMEPPAAVQDAQLTFQF